MFATPHSAQPTPSDFTNDFQGSPQLNRRRSTVTLAPPPRPIPQVAADFSALSDRSVTKAVVSPFWPEGVSPSSISSMYSPEEGEGASIWRREGQEGRPLRPLPKRQRLYTAQALAAKEELSSRRGDEREGGGLPAPAKREKRNEDAPDEVQDPYNPVVSTEATREYRPAVEGLQDGTASDHPPRIHVPPLNDYISAEREDSTKTSLDPSNESDSPPTSPSSILSLEPKLTRGPDYFPLFGDVGDDLVRSLSTSSAGLFDGLTVGARAPPIAAERPAVGEDEEDDEGYAGQDRASEGRLYVDADGSGFGGSNKKKRKIPGVTTAVHEDDDRGYEAGEELGSNDKSRYAHVEFPVDGILSKVRAADTPTTAKAALAKLRIRPLHISASHFTSSHRQYVRRRNRRKKHYSPLTLPPAAIYYTPAGYSTGPPPLPPGSGLKGSKALKAAKKLEKEREKEKERIKSLLGGGRIKLAHFWTPLPLGVDLHSSTSEPLTQLQSFTFDHEPPVIVTARWKALIDHIERTRQAKVARERAQKAREEEAQRQMDKEASDAADAAAAASKAASSPEPSKPAKKAPISPPKRLPPPASPRSGGESASAPPQPRSPAPNDSSTSLNTNSTSTSTLDPSQIPPSTRPPPLKKGGKKKRSAHANSLNSHHRSNYVPSRMPAASTPTHAPIEDPLGPDLMHWPASDEAIAAAGGPANLTGLFSGSDEWLCTFCDYELFFGDLSKVITKRKKVLKIRERARERASKAARGEGKGAANAPAPVPATEPTPAATPSNPSQAS